MSNVAGRGILPLTAATGNFYAMRCPFCDKDDLNVTDSRKCESENAVRRRRTCLHCGKRFTTYERIEQTVRINVIKRDGRRVPWNREKIRSGLERACFKRRVTPEQIQTIVEAAEDELVARFDREVPSGEIGQLVSDALRRIDQVAYVRFASVHRQFKTLEELVSDAKEVLAARQFEDDKAQGRLFVEPTAGAALPGDDQAMNRKTKPRRPASTKE